MTTNGTRTSRGPLDFGIIEGNPRSGQYGACYWGIGLPDGREMMLHADRIEVGPSGELVAWQDTRPVDDGLRREPLESGPCPMMILPAGAWTHCYAASVLYGSPVCVDHLPDPVRP